MTLLYDADCGFCTWAADWAGRMLHGVEVCPLQSVELAERGVDRDRAVSEIPFCDRDGTVSYGSDAVAAALVTSGGALAWVGRLALTRPVRPVADASYRLVARNRHRLPGSTASCELGALDR